MYSKHRQQKKKDQEFLNPVIKHIYSETSDNNQHFYSLKSTSGFLTQVLMVLMEYCIVMIWRNVFDG
jgi:hypothetical protein